MTEEELRDHFHRELQHASEQLLGPLGFLFQGRSEESAKPEGVECAAALGFVGPNLRGTLFLATTGGSMGVSSAMHDDWLGELANQLVGRVKNRLHKHGVDYTVSPPLVLRGTGIEAVTFGAEGHLRFRAEDGDCQISFIAKTRDLESMKPGDTDEDVLEEGDLCLF
ncbi:MAG: chemotaxis protein CheX [Myxococcota bacterium]